MGLGRSQSEDRVPTGTGLVAKVLARADFSMVDRSKYVEWLRKSKIRWLVQDYCMALGLLFIGAAFLIWLYD